MPCPARHLPEGRACVPVPPVSEPLEPADREISRERAARGATFELIPRRPDRPAEPDGVAYPLAGEPLFLRGFEDVPIGDASPTSVELVAERGAPVQSIALEGQLGGVRVLGVVRMIGTTVITQHAVTEGGRDRTYLLLHGHLDAAGPDVRAGTELAPGAVVGFVGDSGNPGIVSLYLEARLVREDVQLADVPLARLADASVSVACDLRNVLPAR